MQRAFADPLRAFRTNQRLLLDFRSYSGVLPLWDTHMPN